MLDKSGDSLSELQREGKRIQELIARIDDVPDPSSRAMLEECIGSLLRFYGQGLARILDFVGGAGPHGQEIYDRLVNDAAVRGLLLIHDLHPVPLETRLREALDTVRPYMESHGGNVELLSLEEDVARLGLRGHCQTCPSSSVTLELAIRGAIEEACPDLMGIEVEGLDPRSTAPVQHLPNGAPVWVEIDEAKDLPEGSMIPVFRKGISLIVCQRGGQLYAYRDHCPACNMPLRLGAFENGILICSLGHRYDARRAGAPLDQLSRHLDPLPLLVQEGSVRIAIGRESHEENEISRPVS